MKQTKGLILHLLALALLATPSLAQQPASEVAVSEMPVTSSLAAEPKAQQQPGGATPAEGLSTSNYEIISSVEAGYRALGIDGNRNKYYSDLNYRAGFRLFDVSFLVRAREGRKGGLFDTFLLTASGFDADPHGSVRVNAEKTRWYKFDMNFRRNSYDNFIACCNLAQVRLPGAPDIGQGEHTARVKHKLGDFDLKLLPQNRNIRFNLGYTMDRYRGPGSSSLSYARDDFQIGLDPWRSRSDEVRGGFEAKLGGLDLNFTQGYRYYRDDSAFVSGFNIGNAGPPGNQSFLTSYYRSTPMRGRAWYSRVSAHTQLAGKFDITARYTYTNSRSRFTFTELATGRGTLENTSVFIDLNRVTASGDRIERPTHLADVGFTWRVTPKLRISDTARYNSFRVDGSALYRDERFLRRTSTGTPFLPYPVVIDLNPSRELELRRWQNNLELDYDFGPRLSFFVGHRFIHRRQEEVASQRVYPLNLTGPAGSFPADARAFFHAAEAENSTNGFFGGFKARPVKAWTVWFDANRGQSDNAFTRMDNYDTLSFRVRNRIQPRRGLNINLSFITRDNNNPGVADEELLGVPEFDVDISSRTFTSSLDWSPDGGRFWVNGGYTYQRLTSDVGIIFNPGGVGTAALGRDQYYLRDHFFFFNASVRLHSRVSFYASYRGHDDRGQGDRETDDAAGLFVRSLPLRFQSPEARLIVRLSRRLDWTVGYQYFDYKEKFRDLFPDLYVNQDYRAHLPYTSVRLYFGQRDR
jgi:hypothetical protein